MSAAALMTLATRLVALYLLAQTIAMAPMWVPPVIGWLGDDPATEGIGQTIVAMGTLSLAVVALLWFGAPLISRLGAGRARNDLVIQQVNVPELASMAIAIAGLILVVLALPSLISLGLQHVLIAQELRGMPGPRFALQLGAEVLRLILGLALLLGAPGLTRLLYRLRFAGHRPMEAGKGENPPPQL